MQRFKIVNRIKLFLTLFALSFIQVGATNADPLRVGLTGKYPPFNYFDNEGNLTGFDVDISKAICKEIDQKCDFVILQWDGILNALLSNKIDAIIGSMAITEERSKQVFFTKPYYESGAQLFLRPDAPSKDKKGFKIGVTLGTTYGEFAKKEFPNAEIKFFKGDVDILEDIKVKRLDAIVTDKLVGLYMIEQTGAPLKIDGPLLFTENIAIPILKERTLLQNKINQAITKIRTSALYDQLLEKYFGDQVDQHQSSFKWSTAFTLLLKGLWQTICVSFSGILFGIFLGVLFSICLSLKFPLLHYPILSFVDFIRCTPFLVQLFAVYFGLPSIGIKLSAWNSAFLAIAIHSASYLAVIIKTAYESIPIAQRHAGQVLGLNRLLTLKKIIIPQMIPLLMAPTLNTVIAMIKDSAMVSVISVHELTLQAQELISATFRPMEFYIITAILYFLITYPFLLLGKRLEKNFKSRGLLNE